MKVEHVVIGDVQEVMLIKGIFASTVLLGGVVNGISVVEVMVVEPSVHELQGTVTVVKCVYVLQVEVMVVIPPIPQEAHGTTMVVSNGVVGMGVTLLDELDDEDDVDSGATGVLPEELVVVVSGVIVEVTGTVIVTGVVEMVDIVVMVLIAVTVLTAGVLVVVTTEPSLLVDVIVLGAALVEL